MQCHIDNQIVTSVTITAGEENRVSLIPLIISLKGPSFGDLIEKPQ